MVNELNSRTESHWLWLGQHLHSFVVKIIRSVVRRVDEHPRGGLVCMLTGRLVCNEAGSSAAWAKAVWCIVTAVFYNNVNELVL